MRIKHLLWEWLKGDLDLPAEFPKSRVASIGMASNGASTSARAPTGGTTPTGPGYSPPGVAHGGPFLLELLDYQGKTFFKQTFDTVVEAQAYVTSHYAMAGAVGAFGTYDIWDSTLQVVNYGYIGAPTQARTAIPPAPIVVTTPAPPVATPGVTPIPGSSVGATATGTTRLLTIPIPAGTRTLCPTGYMNSAGYCLNADGSQYRDANGNAVAV